MSLDEAFTSLEIDDVLRRALEALLKASKYAADTNCSIWDFAVVISELFDLGASESDLRWLVRKGFVEHNREVTIEGDDGRQFRSTGDLTFTRRTCFVLTRAGSTTARSLANCSANGHSASAPIDIRPERRLSQAVPHWDAETRRLLLDGRLIKRFKWPAVNQEAVLCAFQEEGWRERIDDPLPPRPEQDSKRRLADTIKCLNRKQLNELIHFHGDGTGEGVLWERVEGHAQSDGI